MTGNGDDARAPADLGALGPVVDWAEEALEFLGRRVLGEYQVDEFGHDPDLVEHDVLGLLRRTAGWLARELPR